MASIVNPSLPTWVMDALRSSCRTSPSEAPPDASVEHNLPVFGPELVCITRPSVGREKGGRALRGGRRGVSLWRWRARERPGAPHSSALLPVARRPWPHKVAKPAIVYVEDLW